MSWWQQYSCEAERWHAEMEARIQKMERDVGKGSALQQILKAERRAANRVTETTLEKAL